MKENDCKICKKRFRKIESIERKIKNNSNVDSINDLSLASSASQMSAPDIYEEQLRTYE
jgi:hypothetical protein